MLTRLSDDLLKYIQDWKLKKGSLIMILHSVQAEYGYVSRDVCFFLAKEIKIPLARIYEVLTFYNYFKLKPSPKFNISVCLGTACYLKGAKAHIEYISEVLNINNAKISEDGLFSIEEVRCVGCCGLAPVMTINNVIYGKLTKEKILEIINQYRKEAV